MKTSYKLIILTVIIMLLTNVVALRYFLKDDNLNNLYSPLQESFVSKDLPSGIQHLVLESSSKTQNRVYLKQANNVSLDIPDYSYVLDSVNIRSSNDTLFIQINPAERIRDTYMATLFFRIPELQSLKTKNLACQLYHFDQGKMELEACGNGIIKMNRNQFDSLIISAYDFATIDIYRKNKINYVDFTCMDKTQLNLWNIEFQKVTKHIGDSVTIEAKGISKKYE